MNAPTMTFDNLFQATGPTATNAEPAPNSSMAELAAASGAGTSRLLPLEVPALLALGALALFLVWAF